MKIFFTILFTTLLIGCSTKTNMQSPMACPRGIYAAGTIINASGVGEPMDSPIFNPCINGMIRWEDIYCKGTRGFKFDQEKCISYAKSKDGIEMSNAYKNCMRDQGWKLVGEVK